MTNSRAKGCRGEREFAAFLRDEGFDARRGQQYSGSPDSPDVVSSVKGVHWEVKRVERLQLYPAFEQARADAGDDMPVVAHKRNRHEWLCILSAKDLMTLLREVRA